MYIARGIAYDWDMLESNNRAMFCSITEQLLSLRSHKMANGYKV